MNTSMKIHVELLQRQVAELFRAVNDRAIHRNRYNDFKPMVLDGQPVIEFSHTLPEKSNGRSYADIHVKTEACDFWFRQWFNFGVLLNMEILYRYPTGPTHILNVTLDQITDDPSEQHKILIDFEYALSMATESVATNLTNLE